MKNLSGEPEFNSWWKQFFARLYLSHGQILDYQNAPYNAKMFQLSPVFKTTWQQTNVLIQCYDSLH
jgi:hypothetical protein